ncbi:MAG: glucose-6-phosphate dehydrogenase, partial [Alphaproteobacteria bacterium]|nr:glucose-6-phosphate dehydrogenase [Alphaproteobacteria bacterium]
MTDRETLPQSAIVPASDYVIIGGTGDLSLRKIFPALFLRYAAGQVTNDFRLFVVSRQEINANEFREKMEPHCASAISEMDDGARLMDRFMCLVEFACIDISQPMSMAELADTLLPKASEDRPIIFYMSIAPSLFSAACQRIHEAGLVLPQSRLVVEKPLGHDRASSQEINDELLAIFSEDQIYRIDHYLGKETVQNLMALRFANVIFEALWNNRYIDNIQITVAEIVGAGNRAAYYDNYGAIRDMLQNHLLQLLCLVAMEPPARFNADQVRNEKLRVLQALRPVSAEDVILGQYKDYPHEVGTQTSTETFVALKVLIDNWRWAGVPFYIRTGKNLKTRASEIVITFKNRPHDIFAGNGITDQESEIPNRLIIRVQPHEGLRLLLTSKEPGPGGMRLFPSELNLSFGETFNERLPEAYERLL